MKTFTINDIRKFRPCYDPSRYLPEDWQGNALDILKHSDIPAKDKLWVVFRSDALDDRTLRVFAVDSARRALSRIPNPDPMSLAACDVAERFAKGEATEEELADAAAYAADAATYVADAAAAWAAAYAAAYAAAWAAAYAADAADAVYAAAYTAAYAADAAAYAAAWAGDAGCERQAQVDALIKLLGDNHE